VDEKVRDAAPRMSDERLAAMWLYGWHHAGGDDACRPSISGAVPSCP
jgi:hypothetical protein